MEYHTELHCDDWKLCLVYRIYSYTDVLLQVVCSHGS